MKKHFERAIPLLFFSLIAFPSVGQTNVISADIFGLRRERKNISFERSFKDKFSIRLAYENQRYSNGETNGQTVYEVNGIGFIPEFRYYPFNAKKPAPLGFFAGSSFRYIKATEKFIPLNIKSEGTVLNYTFISGYKFNLSRFTSEILAGYGSGIVNGLDDASRSQIDPFFSDNTVSELKGNLRIEISLGFYFPKLKGEAH
jgi:hypothetical protein